MKNVPSEKNNKKNENTAIRQRSEITESTYRVTKITYKEQNDEHSVSHHSFEEHRSTYRGRQRTSMQTTTSESLGRNTKSI